MNKAFYSVPFFRTKEVLRLSVCVCVCVLLPAIVVVVAARQHVPKTMTAARWYTLLAVLTPVGALLVQPSSGSILFISTNHLVFN